MAGLSSLMSSEPIGIKEIGGQKETVLGEREAIGQQEVREADGQD